MGGDNLGGGSSPCQVPAAGALARPSTKAFMIFLVSITGGSVEVGVGMAVAFALMIRSSKRSSTSLNYWIEHPAAWTRFTMDSTDGESGGDEVGEFFVECSQPIPQKRETVPPDHSP